MKKYRAVYKCLLCGALLRHGQEQEVPYDKLPELCAMVVKNQQFVGTMFYRAPLQIPHKCKDGSCGMAHFAGFQEV